MLFLYWYLVCLSIAVMVFVFAVTVRDTAAEWYRDALSDHQKQEETIPETNISPELIWTHQIQFREPISDASGDNCKR